ncbi:mucin-5AC [Nocardioidaceae bacterium Broad-1]|nr:mucin-5AC [Nocardioidaceae bacterium Broad-1]
MRNPRRTIGSATTALLFAVAAGCAQSPGTDPSTNPPSTKKTSTDGTPKETDSEVASASAKQTIHDYFATVDKLGQDDDQPVGDLGDVATSRQLSVLRTTITQQRKAGQRQTGSTKVAELKVQSVNMDNSDPAAGKVPTVIVDVCWDVSDVDVVDKSGKSIVSPNRPDAAWTRYTVANYHWSDHPTDGWRVASGQDLKQSPCKAS